MIKTCCVDNGEQEVAQFACRFFLVFTLQLGLQFIEFLTHFCPHVLLVLPIEAHIARLVLYAVCLDKRRQGIGHTRKNALVTVFLAQFNLLPVLKHLPGTKFFALLGMLQGRVFQRLRLAIDVRMAEDKLVRLLIAHISDIEFPLFLTYTSIEDDVHYHVAEFLANVLRVVFHQGVAEFEGLFYGVRPQTFVCLLAVPRAFLPKSVEHIEQSSERLKFFLSCMHDWFNLMQK